VNERFTFAVAEELIERGDADAVSFGKLFIANPDLPRRYREGAALNEPVSATFYAAGPEGYIDYPSLESAATR